MANITKVYLLNVPLESDYTHTLYFSSASAQQSYFAGRIQRSYTDFNYQRKDNIIRVEEHFDNLINCNYVMYQNTAHSNKWYYAFINNIEYVNDGRSDIHIETDVLQTYAFDYTVKSSFVEREHVKSDTIGEHTVPEGLELGEYVANVHIKDTNLKPANMIVMGSTVLPSGEGGYDKASIGGTYNGVYSGSRYYGYPAASITQTLQTMADNGAGDAVTSLFLCPSFLQEQAGGGPIAESQEAASYTFSVVKPTKLDGYTPKNKKLLTYPYHYLLASNGNGGSAIYEYEHFASNTCKFVTYGVLTPGCSIRMIPTIYKGCQLPENEGLNLGKYPQCNWATDQYTNWLTQNGVNIATSLVTAGANIFAGAKMGTMTGGPTGAIVGAVVGGASGVAGIATTMQEVRNADRVPPQSQGNINCGDVVTATGDNTFHYYKMSIKAEYAKIIDGYFTAFGYKVNAIKVPNKAHRSSYWFTKCIDVNITGAIPQQDLLKIKACYNKGVTFWRSASNIKDYSVENTIV